MKARCPPRHVVLWDADPGGLPFSLLGKDQYGFTLPFAPSLDWRDIPFCLRLEGHWAKVWHSGEPLLGEGRIFYRIHSVAWAMEFRPSLHLLPR